MTMLIEVLVSALLLLGGAFALLGSVGLLKLQGVMQRLHAPTKATTIGVGAILIAAAIDFIWQTGTVTWSELLVMIFLFMTAPLSALYLAKAHLHAMKDRSILPPTGTDAPWAGEPDR